jgi:hypothetical protein
MAAIFRVFPDLRAQRAGYSRVIIWDIHRQDRMRAARSGRRTLH